MAAGGVALAISFSSILQVCLLFAIWNRRTSNKESRNVYLFYFKILLLAIPVGFFLEWLKRSLYDVIQPVDWVGNLAICTVIGLLFLGIFISSGYLFRIHEISELAKRFFPYPRKK
jgi:peptidoglycan biosynthesis protein MviN/MurJ (putative lipid II flippase)